MRGSYTKYEEIDIDVSDDDLVDEVITRLKSKLPTKLSKCEDFLLKDGNIMKGEWVTGHNRDYEISALNEEQAELAKMPIYNKVIMTIIQLKDVLG